MFVILAEKREEFKYAQTLTDTGIEKSLFGRDAAFSASNRIAVGAPYETVGGVDKHGAVHVYEFDPKTQKYYLRWKLIGQSPSPNIELGDVGDRVEISGDGNRIVSGAPYTNVTDGNGKFFHEVGALLIFDLIKDEWKCTVLIPESADLEADQGLGRSIAITADGNTVSGAYYNKHGTPQQGLVGSVFVATYGRGTWSPLTKIDKPSFVTESDQLKWGSSMLFPSSTQLVVAVEVFTSDPKYTHGTLVYEFEQDKWVHKQEIRALIPPPGVDYDRFGSPISINDAHNMLMSQSEFKRVSTIYMVKKVDGIWEQNTYERIEIPEGYHLGNVAPSFCGNYLLMTDIGKEYKRADGTIATKVGAGLIYELSQGKYGFKQPVFPPEEEVIQDLDMGSGVAWSPNCQKFVLGAMNKNTTTGMSPALDHPKAFVFEAYEVPHGKHGLSHGAVVAIIVVSVLVAIALIVSVVVYFIIQYNKKKLLAYSNI